MDDLRPTEEASDSTVTVGTGPWRRVEADEGPLLLELRGLVFKRAPGRGGGVGGLGDAVRESFVFRVVVE